MNKQKLEEIFAMLATDFLSTGIRQRYKTLLGLEFSGLDENGEQVMGLVPAEGLSTHIVRNPTFTWKVPEHWFVYFCKIILPADFDFCEISRVPLPVSNKNCFLQSEMSSINKLFHCFLLA